MKKTITTLSLALSCFALSAQTTVADFEGLSLAADTFYENHSSASWQTSNATFRYYWDTQFSMWDAGFAYTNKNNTADGSYNNLYGAVTGKGYNTSSKYVTASQGYAGDKMRIKLNGSEKSVLGFFVTNTTYGHKVMLDGGGPARAFGDTLHTSSGMKPGDYPDWFKLTVYGYKNGAQKAEKVEFYLADYRFTDNSKDYIVKTWEWVDCSPLGHVDSVSMKLTSSDVGAFGINNPTYFCIDNFTTSTDIVTGIAKQQENLVVQAYPNPFKNSIVVNLPQAVSAAQSRIVDISGTVVYEKELSRGNSELDLSALESGIYFLEVTSGEQRTVKKLVKH